MKKTILTVALSISASLAFAQSDEVVSIKHHISASSLFEQKNESLFVQHKWIDLQTNSTDLIEVEKACQAHGADYHVPTSTQLSTFKKEYRDKSKRSELRDFLLNTLSAEIGDGTKVRVPRVLVNFHGEARRGEIEATLFRGTVKYMPFLDVGNDPKPTTIDETITSILTSFIGNLMNSSPVLNVCVETEDYYSRTEIRLPPLENESEKLLDFIVTSIEDETCLKQELFGTITKRPANGTEGTHYVLADYTFNTCPKGPTSRLVLKNSNIFAYDSSEPFVLYVPQYLQVEYFIRDVVR
ncbi:hypothetical protein HC752_09360 [Vibrio sp. S9_S30]|uniref:ecotin family protein n=1 Tax=Vibrio sp. S9_S30 TaxID=2720226 RepID=UPI001681274D|nr:ecotin family protein [Vibrio sp. S9_S30]MBD1557147.1 hypothetical protein [Vibrio sp. S9_S30]